MPLGCQATAVAVNSQQHPANFLQAVLRFAFIAPTDPRTAERIQRRRSGPPAHAAPFEVVPPNGRPVRPVQRQQAPSGTFGLQIIARPPRHLARLARLGVFGRLIVFLTILGLLAGFLISR